jgi:DNA-binding FadR family transcriptional regulator
MDTTTNAKSEVAIEPSAGDGQFGEQLGGPKLSDRVAVDLQVRILGGEFEPAHRLPPEAKLCEAFGVSRSVIRDAIRTLAARGLVDVQQGRGTTISEPSESALGFAMLALVMRSDMTMEDVLEMRAAVEGQLLPLATQNRTEDDIKRVTDRFNRFEQAVQSKEWGIAHEQHLEFHLALIGSIGLEALSVFLRPMEEIINLSSLPPRGDDPVLWEVDAHRAILNALQAGDAGAMSEAVEQHFDFMRREPYLTLRLTRFRDAVGADALKSAVQRASA